MRYISMIPDTTFTSIRYLIQTWDRKKKAMWYVYMEWNCIIRNFLSPVNQYSSDITNV